LSESSSSDATPAPHLESGLLSEGCFSGSDPGFYKGDVFFTMSDAGMHEFGLGKFVIKRRKTAVKIEVI
jgi:hypothetical protein